jgi:pyruvate dehydrogenase kinase 2/3/4
VVNAVDSAAPVQTVYVPAHLYHILFELFKNALRATVEAHEDEELPAVKVLVVKSSHDVSIKISDRGGGIPRYETKELFNYLYSTAPTPALCAGGAGSAPLAGLGYGLPLSRLYARYFHGDIVLSSFDGYGTDATLYLRALAREASEVLPIFNQMSKQQYVRPRPMVADWTDPSSNLSHHLGRGRTEQGGNTWNKKEEETL